MPDGFTQAAGAADHEPTPQSVRTLIGLAIERIYAAGRDDIPWRDALAAVAVAHGCHQAMLHTPGHSEPQGGLWSVSDKRPAARIRPVFCELLELPGMPPTIFSLFRGESHAALGDWQLEAARFTCGHLAVALRLWFRRAAAAKATSAAPAS